MQFSRSDTAGDQWATLQLSAQQKSWDTKGQYKSYETTDFGLDSQSEKFIMLGQTALLALLLATILDDITMMYRISNTKQMSIWKS
uniref:Uncharacterized protein n=1 Tax=Sphaerodactylus townsendi TaxID=933632 RepID=A0ACB8FBQ2_9SAUR